MLQAWAQSLLAPTGVPVDLDLRIADAMAALFVGLSTREGKALRAFYGSDPADPLKSVALASALIRLSECDDIHLPSCVTPGAVVIPAALSVAGELGAPAGPRIGHAVAGGYAAGLRLGAAIGGAAALGIGVWPTLLCAPLMAAVTSSILRGHDADQLAHAMAIALAGRSGRLGRPAGAPSGRWLAIGEAVLSGLRASRAAGLGFKGDLDLVNPAWLAAQSRGDLLDHAALDFARPAPSTTDVAFKPFVTARQGANAIVALQGLLADGVAPHAIERILVEVPSVNVAMLARPLDLTDRLSSISNVGYQCALAALAPDLLYDADRAVEPRLDLVDFAAKVEVAPAADLDRHWPHAWPARMTVFGAGSQRVVETIHIAGDPGQPDAAALVKGKIGQLAAQGGGIPVEALAGLDPSQPGRRTDLFRLFGETLRAED